MRHYSIAAAIASLLFGFTSAFAADHEVIEKAKKFEPKKLSIKAGDTLTFVNTDGYVHNVHSKSEGNEFDIGAQDSGASDSVTLANPGKVKIRCAIHPKMKMTVMVE